MRLVISGATGTIGTRLLSAQPADAEVTILSRDAARARQTLEQTTPARCSYVAWDGTSPLDPTVFEGVEIVYHLAGEPVAEGRWSREKKLRIVQSRVLGTRSVVDAIAAARARPVLVCASAVGFYGDRGAEAVTEEDHRGTGFLAEVCSEWEAEASRAELIGARVSMMRIGIVLALSGGALTRMLPIFRTGLGGPIGKGDQWMPWIHIDDVVGLMQRAAIDERLAGAVNVVAPGLVTNETFTRELAKILRRPSLLRAPALALRLAMGELAEVVLASQKVLPAKAVDAGYAFAFPQLPGALNDLLGPRSEEVES